MEPLQPDDPRAIGPYRIAARLGAGGMGVVYLGRSRSGRPVAVKVVHRRFVGEDRYRARFRREVDAARAVAGAFTAPVLDADPDAATPWLATAYLPGPSLREAVAGFGPLPPDALRALAVGLAEAVAAIHRGGLVHRDLKPGNVLLTADGPRVIDFGIARPEGATAITRAGAPIGTAGYMGPEQVRGEKVGPPGDVFALGATLAYAATGVEPFGTGPARARHLRVLTGAAALDTVAEPGLRELLAACLRPEPAARPSAAGLLDALGRPGPDEPSLQGIGWLPGPVAAEVGRRTAEVVPAATAPPGGTGPWRPGRRTFITGIGAGALTLAAAGVPLVGGTADGGTGEAPDPSEPREPPPRGVPRWSRRFPGESVGLEAADGVILASADNRVHALDPRTGEARWERAGTSATVAGDDVYLAEDESRRLHAVRAASGGTRWTYDFGFREGGLLAASGVVVCFGIRPMDADEQWRVRALGRKDGRRNWTSEPIERVEGIFAGAELVVAAAPTALTALDAATGRLRWTYRIDHGDHLLVDRDLVLAWDRLGTLHALRPSDGRLAWKRPDTGPLTIRRGGGRVHLEGSDGELVALDAATGRPSWSRRVARLPDDPRAQGTVLCLDGGTLYAACRDGTLYALDAADGRVGWIYQAEEIRLAPPVSAAGLVCVATKDGHVRAIAPPDTPGGSRAGS
ncbi:serine/threonine-protein kinase [Actinomadura algeriensis]|uniref:Outer membrane protein assembly factor BamB n=1 Tax=Actinomadura algeriensis TaxID=1679523 RepID=A0ABR9JSD0_9ACTN|nr:serine/threonine-protein kinase [Actinomadura algeriensis]MBE1533472.1 outer membrane protein assembly factor BamB [Actinomadura algeriensis]